MESLWKHSLHRPRKDSELDLEWSTVSTQMDLDTDDKHVIVPYSGRPREADIDNYSDYYKIYYGAKHK